MSAAASIGRRMDTSRFYSPPAVRRQLELQQQQQQQQQQPPQQQQTKHKQQQQEKEREREEIRREKHQHQHQRQHHHQNHNHYNQQNSNQYNQRRQKVVPVVASGVVKKEKAVVAAVAESSENRVDSDDCASTATTATTATAGVASVSSSSMSNSTNLDRFLEFTTPLVPAQYLSKTSMKKWSSQEDEFRPYFVLGDLWESFKEWSAYGAGVPLLLNGCDSVMQYYVPYLSGIQLYIDPSKPSPKSRRPGEESGESSRETSSNGSSDCEIERGANSIGPWHQQNLGESMKGLSLQSKPLSGSSSEEGESSSSPGVLIFEYFEHDPPFSREPLADKISLLASRFPELKSCRSCDLSQSSWVSVAWYPIYRIPTGPTLQNLDSCFLTFHSLSTPVHGGQNEWQCQYGSCPKEVPNDFDMAVKLSLPIFGMASYKFKISVWDQSGGDESQRANSLSRTADEWLRLLNVNHPDYRFFASHNHSWR